MNKGRQILSKTGAVIMLTGLTMVMPPPVARAEGATSLGAGSGQRVDVPKVETAPNPARESKPVFDSSRAPALMETVNKVVRETASSANSVVGGLRSALDVRLPLVLESCDMSISHEILRVAYGVVTEAPDSVSTLREIASDFSRREMSEFKGVTPDCAAALKGLGVAVTRVYLGSKWEPK